MATTVVSFRIKPEELAKALEVLTEKGVSTSNLTTISNIVRMTFYHGIIANCDDPEVPARMEYQQTINQLLNQSKRSKDVGIKNFLNGE